MEISHELLVYLAKTLGLLYFVGMSLVVVIFACWPANKKRFQRAAESIFDDEKPS